MEQRKLKNGYISYKSLQKSCGSPSLKPFFGQFGWKETNAFSRTKLMILTVYFQGHRYCFFL